MSRTSLARLGENLGDLPHHHDVDRKDLQQLSQIRIREAGALANLGMHDGAYYLAGYSVECALKACIAKTTRRHEFPDKEKAFNSYTHNLRDLIRAAGLQEAWAERRTRDVIFNNNWENVLLWTEQSRYRTTDAARSAVLLDAVANRTHGVLRWLKLHW